MHFTSLFTVAALSSVALSKPASGIAAINDGASAQLQKRAGEVITTGAVGLGDDQVHSRLEINDLSSNRPDMWSLYIRTMARWKDVAGSDDTGYYGISTIHGVPRISWNGVEQCDSCEDADGYCTHDSVLFPAWHRAYMALYEQELIKVALEVADSFDGAFGDRLKAAAQKLRVPYWDWAAAPDSGISVLPPSIAGQQVTIAGPNGDEIVDNPLFSYHFEDPSTMYYAPFTDWTNTLRYPNSGDADATSQESQAVGAFDNLQQNMQDQVYQLLTQCKDYLGFATDDASNNACANSLEGIHNTIHTACGGAVANQISGGHMTYLPLASFDPIFWIHHANIDRIFALWQTANPEQYGASQTAPHSTWTIASGSTQDANSPLMPFRKSENEYWTTNDVKDFEAVFKYSYPEFVVGDQSRATIINYINAIYGSSSNETASSLSARAEQSDSTDADSPDQPRSVTPTQSNSTSNKAPGYNNGGSSGIGIGIGPISLSIGLPWGKPTKSASGNYPTMTGAWNGTKTGGYPAATGTSYPSRPQTPLDPAFIAPNGSVYQYQCNVQTPRYAFNGSYIVYVFDGQPSSNDTSTWLADDSCIGQIGVLAGGDMENHGIMSSGSVPITRHLQKQYKAGKLSGLSEEVVVPYMTKNLNWKIVYRGEEIHPNELKGYKASFLSGLLSPLLDGELPSWSNLIPQVEVTKGKSGGITKIVDGLLGGVGDAVGDIGDAVSPLLGGGSSHPTGYGSGSSPSQPQPTGYAPHDTEDSPVPQTTAAPVPTYPDEEEVVTVYETKVVTYCPCKESATTAALAQPSATAYAKAY
ncbi:putative tyrosinase copper-binding domain, di-copper centre-containing domain superfamily, tyosinase [Septoria linicola]|nr:putative tyrosinase copper-binding domain, di-copper centre-containing domain superfamily, tyosinase [Septoria linicola]